MALLIVNSVCCVLFICSDGVDDTLGPGSPMAFETDLGPFPLARTDRLFPIYLGDGIVLDQ